MKLIFDQNLSRRLPTLLHDLYPGSVHVRDVGMIRAPDPVIWDFAKEHGYVVTTKDGWFVERSLVAGHPPKIVWICTGNCPRSRIVALLRDNAIRLQEFMDNEDAAFISLQ